MTWIINFWFFLVGAIFSMIIAHRHLKEWAEKVREEEMKKWKDVPDNTCFDKACEHNNPDNTCMWGSGMKCRMEDDRK